MACSSSSLARCMLSASKTGGRAGMPEPLWRQVLDAADRRAAAFVRAYIRAVEQARGRLDARRIEAHLRAFRVDEAARMAEEAWSLAAVEWAPRVSNDVLDALHEGADIARRARQLRLSVAFDRTNPASTAWARDRAAALVTRVTEDVRQAVRVIVTEAFERQIDVRDTARAIRGVIGLRPDQVRAAARYREELQALAASQQPVTRATRMRRLSSRGLTPAKVDAWVQRYEDRLLRQRADLIARTEILTAEHRGQLALWRQQAEAGLLPDGTVKRWIVTPDDRLCPACAAMDGQRRLIFEPFDGGAYGPVIMPPLHPACRCAVALAEIPAGGRRAA